jgi:hypothetical protein
MTIANPVTTVHLDSAESRSEQGAQLAMQILDLLEHPGQQVLTERNLELIANAVAIDLQVIRNRQA